MRQTLSFGGTLFGGVVMTALLAVPAMALAQDGKSAAGAKELAQLLAAKKLDAIAMRDPNAPDTFIAALAFPGQLIVISAKYPAPPLLNERLARNEYRDVYIELNSASVLDSRMIVTDLNADGLRAEEGQARRSARYARGRGQGLQLRRQLARRQDVGSRLHEDLRRDRRVTTAAWCRCCSARRRSSERGRVVRAPGFEPGTPAV